MKKFILSAVLLPLVTHAVTLDDIREHLTDAPCQMADVRFEVLMPSSADPVVYFINLLAKNPGDSLSPCDYLIKWTLPRGNRESKGFSSYHAGEHFRSHDTRLQEYHYEQDPIPFTSSGGGVQRNAQFVDLLPAYLTEKLEEIVSDSTYNYKFNENTGVLSGVRSVNGYDVLEFEYTFDKNTGLPLQSEFIYNPASISEQTVTANYDWKKITGNCPDIDEAFLVDNYGEVFEKFRTSNFRVENLLGTDFPSFSYDVAGRGRISHTRGEPDMSGTAILAFLDSNTGNIRETIEALRNAALSSPSEVDILFAFSNNEPPENFESEEKEGLVNGTSGLIRKCGVTAFPTLLVIDSGGNISDVIIGYSPELETNLLQSLMLVQ